MCDTMVHVTKSGVLFAKNSDREANEAQLLEWHRASEYPDASLVRCTHIEIAQVPRTLAVVIARPWWMFGAEMGANERGVVIGNEAVYTTEPDGEPALLGMDLVRLALERSATAEEAVSVIVDLLERHGQGGPCSFERSNYTYHNSFLIADRARAFVLETAGRLWASEEITAGARSISNGLTIPGFAEQYARRVKDRLVSCARRRERTERDTAQSWSPRELAHALRQHPHGRDASWSPLYGSLGGPCAHFGGVVTSSQTTGSLIADLRDGVQLFATATSAPCLSVFKAVSVDQPVELGEVPTNRYDSESFWWRHERFHRAAMANSARARHEIYASRERFEDDVFASSMNSSEAFARSLDLEASWWDLLDESARDERPSYVRLRAERLDRLAAMPERP